MSYTAYDSIGRKWPAGAEYILAYMDNPLDEGNYAAAVATGATVISISILGTSGAHIYDVEPGCIWPNSKAAQVLAGEVRIGHRPAAYTFLDNWAGLEAAVQALGVSPSEMDWIVASWDNKAVIPNGCVGKQYASGNEFDTSVLSPAWVESMMIQPPLPLPPTPDPTKGLLNMFLIRNPGADVTLDNGAVIRQGEICACDAAGAVNLGTDWPTVQAAYPNEPVMEDAALLVRFAKVSLH